MNDNNSNNNDKNEYKKINNIPNIPNWDLISKTAYQARKFVDTNPIKGLINSGVFDSLKPVKDSLPEIFNQAKITNDLLKKINIDNYLPGSLEYSETFKAFSDLVNNSNITDYFDMHYKTIKDLNFYNNSNTISKENINEDFDYDGTILNNSEVHENEEYYNQIISSNSTDCELMVKYESKLNDLIEIIDNQKKQLNSHEKSIPELISLAKTQNENYTKFLNEKSSLDSKIIEANGKITDIENKISKKPFLKRLGETILITILTSAVTALTTTLLTFYISNLFNQNSNNIPKNNIKNVNQLNEDQMKNLIDIISDYSTETKLEKPND